MGSTAVEVGVERRFLDNPADRTVATIFFDFYFDQTLFGILGRLEDQIDVSKNLFDMYPVLIYPHKI